MPNIPFFDYSSMYTRFKNDFDRIFSDVCARGAFILQDDLVNFERNLASFLSVRTALGVADGTNAIQIGLKACGIGPGDEIVIASHTYVATAAAIKLVGAEPVFADIGDDFLMSAASVETVITPKTKAVMPTQLNGRCCNMDDLSTLAKRYDLKLFEDSAQGLGAKYKGKCAGSFGDFGTLSFYPAKLLGCFGDGGAIMTSDPSLGRRISLYRDHGRDEKGVVVDWGTNSRLDNLQAAILDFKLSRFEEDIARRREIASRYDDAFSNHEMLTTPPSPSDGDHFDVYQNYELAVENRDELQKYLAEKGIKTVVQWGGTPVHHFENLGYGKEKFTHLKKTDWFFDRCLMLPIHMSLTNEDVSYIAEQVHAFYRR